MLLGTVVALSVFSACSLLSTHGWVCSRGKKHKLMIGGIMIGTVDVKVLNPNGPNFFVHNGEAAQQQQKTGRPLQMRSRGPEKIDKPQQDGADGCATHARCCLLVLLGGSFSRCALCSSQRVGCAHGCVHERARNRPNVTGYARM